MFVCKITDERNFIDKHIQFNHFPQINQLVSI